MKNHLWQILAGVAVVVLFVQLAVMGSVILRGENVLSRGIECRFPAHGYDPRDPLRGKYIQFMVKVETTTMSSALRESIKREDYRGRKCYFRVSETPGPDGFTQVYECATEPSAEGLWIGPVRTNMVYSVEYSDRKENEDWNAFEKRRRQSPYKAVARLPEKFYVPENEAPELEKKMRGPKARAVAVYRVKDHIILLTDLQIQDAADTK